MAVVTRRRGVRALVVVAATFPLVLAGGAALLTVVLGGTCAGSGVGDAPSALATRDIPASFLRIYEQVGARYKIPWEVLAGIGRRSAITAALRIPPAPPQPGARGSGRRELCGRVGADADRRRRRSLRCAGDEYQSLRHYLPDPSLGPHDPTTAVELAALVLIKDKGAPTGQPIDAYAVYVRAYNGSGPAADAYAARVLADAHAYQGAGTAAFGPSCSAALGTPLVPGTKARILPSGDAAAPADAPAVVQAMIAAGNRIDRFPYSYGGAHGDPAQTMNQSNPNPAAVPGAEENGGPGYDCSSATSYVLWGGGLGQSLLGWRRRTTRRCSSSVGEPGPGKWVTIFANAGHAYVEVAGHLLRHRGGTRQPAQPAVDRAAVEHRRDRPGRVRRATSLRALNGDRPSVTRAQHA